MARLFSETIDRVVAELRFEDVVVRQGKSYDFPRRHPVQRLVLPVFGRQGSRMVGLGTSVCVGPGWFITAKHVVVEHLQNWAPHDEDDPHLYLYLETDQAPPNNPGDMQGDFLKVRGFNLHTQTDLATLTVLDLPGHHRDRLRHMTLALRMPELGEAVAVVGYRHLLAEGEVAASGPTVLIVERLLNVAVGVVLQQQHVRLPGATAEEVDLEHLALNQSVLQPPGFLIDAPTPFGLSGGAAIDRNQQIIGFVSSSTEPNEELSSWSSHIAGLAPALELNFSAGNDQWMHMAQLVGNGLIQCEFYDSFNVEPNTGNAAYLEPDK